MTERIANVLTEHMFADGLIECGDKEIYHYAIQVLIEKIIGFSTIFLFSIMWGVFLETVFFLLCFSCLRKYTGGFHSESYAGCFVGTTGIYIIYVKLLYPIFLKYMNINMTAFYIAGLLILLIGAVNHPNMEWSKKEYENCKALARIAVIVELFIITSFLYLGMEKDYILFMSFGMILCAFLLALGKITKQEVKTNEKDGTKEFAGNLGKSSKG